jgi:hypothetical protein
MLGLPRVAIGRKVGVASPTTEAFRSGYDHTRKFKAENAIIALIAGPAHRRATSLQRIRSSRISELPAR